MATKKSARDLSYHKGEKCVQGDTFCQEGFCSDCILPKKVSDGGQGYYSKKVPKNSALLVLAILGAIVLGILGGVALGAIIDAFTKPQCPVCKNTIEKGTVICPHCKSWTVECLDEGQQRALFFIN